MVEFVSWVCVALIAIGSLVGFVGLVGTSVVLGARKVLEHHARHSNMDGAVRAG